MSKINYESLTSQSKTESKGFKKVGYFGLKDDGDEAIVRFAYESPKDFDIVSVHRVKVGDYWRDISCLKTSAKEDDSKCPFCSLDKENDMKKIKYRFYCKLIEYVKDENGKITPVAKVWSRPMGFAKTLKSYFEDYGNISDVIFKVKRHGKKGSLDTTYEAIYANPAVYKPDIYIKDFSGFDKFDLSHHSYMIKTPEEIKEYLSTGAFPSKKVEEDAKVEATEQAIKETKANVPFESTPFDAVPPEVKQATEDAPRKPKTFTYC